MRLRSVMSSILSQVRASFYRIGGACDRNGEVSLSKGAICWISAAVLLGCGVIAATIGLDDSELSDYQIRLANLLVRSIGGVAVVAGGIRYLYERHQELSWQKTEFMTQLFSEFDRDERYERARVLVDLAFFVDDHSYLSTILASGGDLTAEQWKDRSTVDRYLDFFDRLYTHVFITRTLSVEDVSSFSGYVSDVYKSPPVRSFALEWGYEDVLVFAEAFNEGAKERDKKVDELRSRLSNG